MFVHFIVYPIQINNINIRPFVVAPDVVSLPVTSLFDNQLNSSGMIIHIEPVPNLFAVAVDGQRFAPQDIEQTKRNKFLRKMIG